MAAANSGRPAWGIDGGWWAAPPQVRVAQPLPPRTYFATDGVDRPLRAFTPRFSYDDGLHTWALLVRI